MKKIGKGCRNSITPPVSFKSLYIFEQGSNKSVDLQKNSVILYPPGHHITSNQFFHRCWNVSSKFLKFLAQYHPTLPLHMKSFKCWQIGHLSEFVPSKCGPHENPLNCLISVLNGKTSNIVANYLVIKKQVLNKYIFVQFLFLFSFFFFCSLQPGTCVCDWQTSAKATLQKINQTFKVHSDQAAASASKINSDDLFIPSGSDVYSDFFVCLHVLDQSTWTYFALNKAHA